MNIPSHITLFFALLLYLGGCLQSSSQSVLRDQHGAHSALEALISERVEESNFSGVVLVADENKIIFEQAFNEAPLGPDFRIDLETQFPIASITKSFTAILVLQLVERGLLDLDKSIADYLPEVSTPYADRVTVRHLLQNRSGIPNYTELSGWTDPDYKRSLTPRVLLQELADLPLKFEPGTDYLYSNANFYLLGLIAETVTDKPYELVLSENILAPLELRRTGQISGEQGASALAKNAMLEDDGTYAHIPLTNPRVFKATASITSTARDLFHWQAGLHDETLLHAEMKTLLFNPDRPMGWTVGDVPIEPENVLSIQTYNGDLIGYASMVTRFPEQAGAVIILNNNNAGYDMLAGLTLDITTELYGR